VALVRTDISEELSLSIIRAIRIGELGTTLPVTSDQSTLQRNTGYAQYIVFLPSVLQLLVTADVAPTSPILIALMMEAVCSSKTSVLTRATRRNIQKDAILHKLIVFGNRVLGRIFGPKRDKLIGGWR
jgi:hypothetical protein